MIIIPVGLCVSCCLEATREERRANRQRTVQRVTIVQQPGAPGRAVRGGQPVTAQPGAAQQLHSRELWSGYFTNDKGDTFQMTACLILDYTRGQFKGSGQENGHDFIIEDGWIRDKGIITFAKVVAGHKATFTGKLEGNEMKGMWYIAGYDQTGGQFSLIRQ